jgi:integrase
MPEIIFSLAEERRDWLELRKETRKKNKKEWSDEYDGYICIADRGEIKSDATLNAALKRICADAGIPIVTTHNLRHIAATMMFEYGTRNQDHLILDGKAQKIKVLHRILGFQRKQRDMLLPHHLIEVRPRREQTLTPDILPPVKHGIQDLHAKVGHTDFVYVRKAHGKPNVHKGRIFHDTVHFPADVSGGLLNG